MPVLQNHKHELFAQALAEGKTADEAYVLAGYQENRHNASRLKTKETIVRRVAEILSEAAAKVGITVERVMAELARIGFADIRKAVEWRGALVREQDNAEGGDVLVIKEIFSNNVRLVDSDRLDADTAAAIAEVRQSPTGGLSIKLHDKQAALLALGKQLGMFRERVEHSGAVATTEPQDINMVDLAKRVAFLLSTAEIKARQREEAPAQIVDQAKPQAVRLN